MKFELTATSGNLDQYKIKREVQIEDSGVSYSEKIAVIEIKDLEDLLDFMKEVKREIIISESYSDSDYPCIEIYDDYRE